MNKMVVRVEENNGKVVDIEGYRITMSDGSVCYIDDSGRMWWGWNAELVIQLMKW